MGLMNWLFGRRGPDPGILLGCQDRLDEARHLMNAGQCMEAATLMHRELERIRPLRGRQADLCRAALLCCFGESIFHAGVAGDALAPLHEAERLVGDEVELAEEVHGNLYETYRYLDYRQIDAANHADRLADLAERRGQPDRARRYRKQAELVREGEPLLRVVADVGGARLEMDELLQGQPGRVRFLLERNRLVNRTADLCILEGERLAHEGDFESALALFQRASTHDAHAPQPYFRAGLMMLYLDRPAAAPRYLYRARSLAPGWPLVDSLLDIAQQVHLGELPREVFLNWHAVEEAPLPAEKKLVLCERALELAPELAQLHEQRGRLLRERGLGPSAAQAFRQALAQYPGADVMGRASVGLAAVCGDRMESERLLRHAIDHGTDLIAAATAQVVLQFGEGG